MLHHFGTKVLAGPVGHTGAMLHPETFRAAWTTALVLGFVVAVLLSIVLDDYLFGGAAGLVLALVAGWLLSRDLPAHPDDTE